MNREKRFGTNVPLCFASHVKGIEPPGKASFEILPMKLGVENPEGYRSKLIELIHQDMLKIRENIETTGKFVLKGLEGPVLVRQVDDTKVEIFLDYELSMQID